MSPALKVFSLRLVAFANSLFGSSVKPLIARRSYFTQRFKKISVDHDGIRCKHNYCCNGRLYNDSRDHVRHSACISTRDEEIPHRFFRDPRSFSLPGFPFVRWSFLSSADRQRGCRLTVWQGFYEPFPRGLESRGRDTSRSSTRRPLEACYYSSNGQGVRSIIESVPVRA